MNKGKKKNKKTMTVEMPAPVAPSAVESVKASLEALEASTGWAIIHKILDDNIKYLELAILEKIDPITKQPISDAEVEILRNKRNLNIDVRDTPKNYRQKLDDTGIVPKEFDPYFKTNDEIKSFNKSLA